MSQIICLGQQDLPKIKKLISKYPFLPYRQIEDLSREALGNFLLQELRDILTNDYIVALKESDELKGLISLKKLPWDSSAFGLRMGKVVHTIGPIDYKESLSVFKVLLPFILKISQDLEIEHLSLRVDTDDLAIIHGVEEAGFRLVDSIVTPIFDLKRPLPKKEGVKIRPYEGKDLEELREMTRGLFKFGRFHTDPNLPDKACDELYVKWVERDTGGYADTILLSEQDGQITGFIACLINKDFNRHFGINLGTIDLFGVRAQNQGRGVGTSLICAALEWFKDKVDLVRSGTMIKNYPAIRIYQKAGFKIVETNFSFHKWLGKNRGRKSENRSQNIEPRNQK